MRDFRKSKDLTNKRSECGNFRFDLEITFMFKSEHLEVINLILRSVIIKYLIMIHHCVGSFTYNN
jgi:hypothetical protein